MIERLELGILYWSFHLISLLNKVVCFLKNEEQRIKQVWTILFHWIRKITMQITAFHLLVIKFWRIKVSNYDLFFTPQYLLLDKYWASIVSSKLDLRISDLIINNAKINLDSDDLKMFISLHTPINEKI